MRIVKIAVIAASLISTAAMANGSVRGCEAFAKGAELAQESYRRGVSPDELRLQVDTAWQAYANAAGLSEYEYQMMRKGAQYGYGSDDVNLGLDAAEYCRNNRV